MRTIGLKNKKSTSPLKPAKPPAPKPGEEKKADDKK